MMTNLLFWTAKCKKSVREPECGKVTRLKFRLKREKQHPLDASALFGNLSRYPQHSERRRFRTKCFGKKDLSDLYLCLNDMLAAARHGDVLGTADFR